MPTPAPLETASDATRLPTILLRRKLVGLAALLVNLIALPLFCFVMLPNWFKGVPPDFTISVLALAGVGAAGYWWFLGVRMARFGPMLLHLDPPPGSLGGNVGGLLDIRGNEWAGQRFQLTLNCIDTVHDAGSGGSGQGRSSREIIRWQDQQEVEAKAVAAGARLGFRFKVPSDLAPSSDPDFGGTDLRTAATFSGTKWVLLVDAVDGPFALARTYVVPVVRTESPLFTSDRVAAADTSSADSLPSTPAGVEMFRREGYFSFFCPWHRNLGDAAVVSLFGIAMGGAAFACFNVAKEGTPLAWLVGGFFAIPALIMLVGVCYLLSNSLRVDVEDGELWVVRRLFGIPWVRRRPVTEISGFSAEIGRQMGSTARASVKYRVHALCKSGNKLVVADGIKGAGAAKALVINLNRACGLEPESKT